MKHHNVVAHVPSFQLSTRSSSVVCAFFLHFYGAIFFGTPNMNTRQIILLLQAPEYEPDPFVFDLDFISKGFHSSWIKVAGIGHGVDSYMRTTFSKMTGC